MTNSTGDSETGRNIQYFLYLNRSPSVFPAEYKRNARPDVSRTIRLHLVKEIIIKKKEILTVAVAVVDKKTIFCAE
jgi:hypothetical protein